MTLSGCSSDETLTGDNSTAVQSMKINVSDGMFTSVDNNGAKTRATDSGTGTTFVKGDAVGIFVVKSDGNLALTNAKYTYDGTSKWLNSNSTEYLPYCEGAKYFAYYPYQESLASSKYDATQTTAETFFGTLISSWTPATDQSTPANYTAQDLMVSIATIDASKGSCSFALSHQMSMVEIDFPQVHYTYNGADVYRFTFDAPNKPYNIADGKYRLLVKPNTSLSVKGKNQYNSTDANMTKGWKISGDAPAASKYKIYKYNGASASLTKTSRQAVYIGDATVGNYLYNDGTNGTTFKPGQTVGIIYSSELTQAQYKAGCRHGRVLSLKNAKNANNNSYSTWGSGSPYTDRTGHPYVSDFTSSYQDVNSGYDALSANSSYVNTSSNYPWYYCNTYNDGTAHSGDLAGKNWYLPSAGDWWDIMENLGTWTTEQKTTLTSMRSSTMGVGNIMISTSDGLYFNDLNSKLNAAGGDKIVPSGANDYLWSASESSGSNSVSFGFEDRHVYLNNHSKSGAYCCMRAVLAF
jgi:uncharacterized protein (TIGR02145 family)